MQFPKEGNINIVGADNYGLSEESEIRAFYILLILIEIIIIITDSL